MRRSSSDAAPRFAGIPAVRAVLIGHSLAGRSIGMLDSADRDQSPTVSLEEVLSARSCLLYRSRMVWMLCLPLGRSSYAYLLTIDMDSFTQARLAFVYGSAMKNLCTYKLPIGRSTRRVRTRQMAAPQRCLSQVFLHGPVHLVRGPIKELWLCADVIRC